MTESIQAGVDPDELREIALDLARNGETESTRIAALNWLRDSGYTRPAERHEVTTGHEEDDEDEDQRAMSLSREQLEALAALDEQRAIIMARSANVLALDEADE